MSLTAKTSAITAGLHSPHTKNFSWPSCSFTWILHQTATGQVVFLMLNQWCKNKK